ncbi:MAG: hypothetical protein KC561_04700 [Myxococcales bacterium]|nr:hypothetical protein [Myxococcales bacterium]
MNVRASAWFVGVVTAIALIVFACARGDRAAEYLTHVEEAQHSASLDAATGELGRARTLLLNALALQAPDELASEDVRRIRQDLYFLLASVELETGNDERALEAADAGIALGGEREIFAANLWLVKGQAFESQGRAVEAARAYHRALEINAALFVEAMEAQ